MPRVKARAATYQDDDFRRALRVGMAREDISSASELSRISGISKDRLRRRLETPEDFTLGEIRQLHKLGVMDAASVLMMVGCNKNELQEVTR